MAFYEKFKALCDAKGVSCKAAAIEIGLANSIVSKWKKDATNFPRHETMLRIAEYFDIDVSELYETEESAISEQENEMFNRVQTLCQMRQISIKAMCNDLHISAGNLSDLKHGRRQHLSIGNLIKIARYFDVSTDHLLGLQPMPTELLITPTDITDCKETVGAVSKNNTLGNRMKKLRQFLNLSQSELAKNLNYTQAALSQYENGSREPRLCDLIAIANYLHTTTDYLLGIAATPHKPQKQTLIPVSDEERNTLLMAILMRIQQLQAFAGTRKDALFGLGIEQDTDKFLQLTLEEIDTLTALLEKLKSDPPTFP